MPETPDASPDSDPDGGPVPDSDEGSEKGSGKGVGSGPGSGSAEGSADGTDNGPDDDAGSGPDALPASPESIVTEAVLNVAGRVTLPFQAARADQNFGTAFWYNDLVEVADGRETIRQYLVTAEPQTRFQLGQFTLRDGLVRPELPADELVLPSFAKKWYRLDDLGVAAMPTNELHLHGERKGWSWAVQEVTAGLAARPEDIESLGAGPTPAYVLGHEVTEPESRHPGRPQTLLSGTVSRSPEGLVTWSDPLPRGCAGAPVFAGLPHGDHETKLVCLGLVLPGDPARVVTFDKLRPALHTLSPPRTRHWWQRRG